MTPEEIAGQWCRVAHGEQIGQPDIFFKFIAAWVAFNAIYSSRFSDTSGDKARVLKFARSADAKNLYKELLKGYAYRDALAVLKARPVRNLLHPSQFVGVYDEEQLEPVLICVYQVRNNLFHGGKQFDDARDEKLVGASYEIIIELIKPFVHNCP